MLGTTMKNLSIRVSQKPFIDRQKFPYGFRKSGDFSIGEADILTGYGKTLLALECGELTPETDDERHFVDFVSGKVDADNTIERTWAKYVRLSRGKKHFYTLHSTAASNQSDYDEDYSDETFDVA
jgi:uncharacterized protein YifE (UPF0438 family)